MTMRVFLRRVLPWAALAALTAVPAAMSAAGAGPAPARGFASGPAAGQPTEVVLQHLRTHKGDYGLTGGDLNDVRVTDLYTDAHNGVTHVYLRQVHRGLDVVGANVNANVASDGSIVSLGSRFVANLAARANGHVPGTSAKEAAGAAAAKLGLKAAEREAAERSATLVYQPVASGAVRLAWEVDVEQAEGDHWWSVRIDATTGDVLAQDDLVAHDTAEAIAAAIARPAAAPRTSLATAAATVADGSSYNVFGLPFESPSDGGRTLVQNPASALASPFGWHDTDGAAGAEFTVTRGNNVHAYADRDANNVADPGSDPDGGEGLDFDFPLDLGVRPLDSQPAIVTNLFYWNNIVHDVMYGFGFTEAAGNFQVNNYGRGGLGGDDVRAEAQDGSGRNNANFGTPVDGLRPRMQMFEWRSSAPNKVTVTAPPAIAGDYFGPTAGFGASYADTGPISGVVEYVNDGVGATGDGCQPFTVAAGAIPLIDRGTCTFVVKVKNAQDAGAATAIVANNAPGAPLAMGGSDPTITIPSLMISQADGSLWKANLPATVTITDGTGGAPDRDSDLDAGVIAHEYGHGISNRLTGGPSTVGCLQNAEQMGEGWSDLLALVLTTHPADTGTTARGVGSYVSFQPAGGVGIRPTVYSTDLAVNPSTYDSIKDVLNISQPHGIGYVWASMYWEVYWNLVAKHGYNADVYGDWSSGGNNLAIQLLLDGMKFQPCSPGFVDGRDAILAADLALTGGDNQCQIWRGFAKRGLGVSAVQGSSSNRGDGTQAFDVPVECTFTFGGFLANLAPPPALNAAKGGSTVTVHFSLGGDKGLDLFNAGYPASQQIDCGTKVSSGGLSPTATPEGDGLVYDPVLDRYSYPWKTAKSWAGTCRQLVLQFEDGSERVAYLGFK